MKYEYKSALGSFHLIRGPSDLALAFDAKSAEYVCDRLNALREVADSLLRCRNAIIEDRRLISTYELRRVAAAISLAYKLEGPG